nr:hypothetical protein [Tanacetum cinerariifolium]
GRIKDQDLFGVHDLDGDEVFLNVTTGENVEQDATAAESIKGITAATIPQISKDELTLAQTLMEIKAAKPKAKWVTIQEPSEFRTTSPPQPSQPLQAKDKGQELEQESAKKQKLVKQEQAKVANDDIAELKRCLEIVPDDDDDVEIEAIRLSSKSPTIVDYKIYREDLEVLRSIVKERFKKIKLVDDMDNLLFQTLKTMFEPHVEDIIYVRLQVDYEVEMAYDLLRLIRRQINEGYKPKRSVWIHPPDEDKDLIKKLKDSDGEHQV